MDDVFTLEAPFFWRFSIAIFDWLPELSPFLAQENHHPKWWDVMGITPPLLKKSTEIKHLATWPPCCWKHDQKLEKNLWSSAIFPQSYPPRASKWCCKKFLTARPVLYSCSIPRPGLRSAIMSIYETMDIYGWLILDKIYIMTGWQAWSEVTKTGNAEMKGTLRPSCD